MSSYPIYRPSPNDSAAEAIAQSEAAVCKSFRALALPHWPEHYFPPCVPYVGRVASTEDEMVARLCADLPDLR